jgi:transcriptional regulator with PAS, ATPase and Fis domain
MDSLQSIKQRFGIIGNNTGLNRALEKAMRVSGTDISVLVIGESGVGRKIFPKSFISIHIENTLNISP